MASSGYEKIMQVLEEHSGLSAGMQELVRFCAERATWVGWNLVLNSDLDSDYRRMVSSVEATLVSEPIPPEINALWFGLFDRVEGQFGEPYCQLYVAGSDHYDSSDVGYEWAVSPRYWPQSRYVESEFLRKTQSTLRSGGPAVVEVGEYTLLLGYTALVVKQMIKGGLISPLPKPLNSYGVAVGFDSGDCITVSSGEAGV